MLSDVFNTREIAFGVWLIIGILVLLIRLTIRKSIKKVIVSVFNRKLIGIYVVMIIYVISLISILYQINLWDIRVLKDTFIWVFFAGIPTLFRISRIKSIEKHLWHSIGHVLGFTAIVEFIVNRHTFRLAIELINVPISFFVFTLLALPRKEEKYKSVTRIITAFATLYGLFLLFYSVTKIATDIPAFVNKKTLDEFLVGPLLSLGLVPFLYLLLMYTNYQNAFILLNKDIKSNTLEKFAKRRAISFFKFDTIGLQRWRNSLITQPVNTKIRIIHSMMEITRLEKIEKKPPDIPWDLGWSPYTAKDFLLWNGIATRYYHRINDDEWTACSTYVKLDDNPFPNDIAYYIDGNSTIANKLTISLSVYSPGDSANAHEQLFRCASSLYKSALSVEMPTEIKKAIKSGSNETMTDRNRKITVIKNQWEGHPKNGYEIEFSIEVK